MIIVQNCERSLIKRKSTETVYFYKKKTKTDGYV